MAQSQYTLETAIAVYVTYLPQQIDTVYVHASVSRSCFLGEFGCPLNREYWDQSGPIIPISDTGECLGWHLLRGSDFTAGGEGRLAVMPV